MIVLRNLMLAVGAFIVTGYGFYFYLLHALPPDKIQAESTLRNPAAGGGAPGGAAPESSSRWTLAAAVLEDFLVANSKDRANNLLADPGEQTSADIPDWLNRRFDEEAAASGKSITTADKTQLLRTLLELREMKQQQMSASAAVTDANTAKTATGSADWALTARAMQAELQFRQTLGIGLAEFMKKLGHENLARLMVIPAAPGKPSDVVALPTSTR